MVRSDAGGRARMRQLLGALPEDLVDGFRQGERIGRRAVGVARRPVLVVGLGGSAIAADFARALLSGTPMLSFEIVRSPRVPTTVDRRTAVVLSTYSGETAEVLAAYEEAGRRRLRRVALTSGGELSRRARRDDVPTVLLPPGRPQRTAIGGSLGGLLGLVDRWLPRSNKGRVAGAARAVTAAERPLALSAANLARAVRRRTPAFYAEADLLPLARRFKTDVEENAKRLAVFDEAPEAFHNAIVGWNALGPADASRWIGVSLEWDGTPPYLDRAYGHLTRLARSRRARFVRLRLPGRELLTAHLYGLALAGRFSLDLADELGADPFSTEAITRYKRAMRRPG